MIIMNLSAGERINLLETILTDRRPPISKHGVGIVREPPFDESGREITGFVFTEEARTLSTSAQSVLNNCTGWFNIPFSDNSISVQN